MTFIAKVWGLPDSEQVASEKVGVEQWSEVLVDGTPSTKVRRSGGALLWEE